MMSVTIFTKRQQLVYNVHSSRYNPDIFNVISQLTPINLVPGHYVLTLPKFCSLTTQFGSPVQYPLTLLSSALNVNCKLSYEVVITHPKYLDLLFF